MIRLDQGLKTCEISSGLTEVLKLYSNKNDAQGYPHILKKRNAGECFMKFYCEFFFLYKYTFRLILWTSVVDSLNIF